MTTVTAVTAFRSAEAVCKTSSRSSRLSRGAGAKVKGGIPAGGDCRKSIQPVPLDFRPTENTCRAVERPAYLRVEIAASQYNPYPLTFGPRKTLAGRWKGPWPFHPAQRRVTKFRRGAGCPFQRAALLGEATAVAGGKAPTPPRRAQMRF